MVIVRDLVKSFGSNHVLRGISLTVAPKEILAVMGSSGGGKTTLLRCISGLSKPTSGMIEVNGIDVEKQPEDARREMGMVFQSAALFDYLNVEENILFGVSRRQRLSLSERKQIVNETLETVGLTGAEKLEPSELSGGMRKRVGIARALALRPSLMLYDEPTTGLDPITTYHIDSLVRDARAKYNVTAILVSHDVVSVFRVADRIAFLDRGEIIFNGSPDEFRKSSEPAINELLEKAYATTI